MKQIPGFLGYSITKDGKVWSDRREYGWLKPLLLKDGHVRVFLYENGKGNGRLVHRLVLETYVGPCPEGVEACHSNGNPADNRLSNLRWDTRSANSLDAVRHGTSPGLKARGEKHGRAKLSEQQVRQIVYVYRTGLFSRREIADQYGVIQQHMGRIVAGTNWRHIWKG